MKQQHAAYQVVPYPRYMRFSAAAYQSVRHKPMIHGPLEVDFTRARTALLDPQGVQQPHHVVGKLLRRMRLS